MDPVLYAAAPQGMKFTNNQATERVRYSAISLYIIPLTINHRRETLSFYSSMGRG
jgi:hypothetical protein